MVLMHFSHLPQFVIEAVSSWYPVWLKHTLSIECVAFQFEMFAVFSVRVSSEES